MGHLLLTNIGNRNITYHGELFNKTIGNENFKEWTLNLLKNYPEIKQDLDINIINPLVTGDIKPSKLYFFSSNQSNLKTRTDQDTIYEGQLIKKILVDKYNYYSENIFLIECNCKVIDNGALMKFYRKQLHKIISQNTEEKIIICDAGGTAQQKMSLKVMAEYLLTPEKYEVKYTEDNELIFDVNINEYRSVINSEIAVNLIHIGEYNAANEILDYNAIELFHLGKDFKKKLYAHSYFRFYGNYNLAQSNLTGKESNLVLANFYNSKLDSDIDISKTKIKSIEWIQLTDKLRKAYFYYKLSNFNLAVLNFAQFYEELFEAFILSNFDTKTYGKPRSQNENQKENLHKLLLSDPYEEDFSKCLRRYDEYSFSIGSLAIQCILLKNSPVAVFRKLGKILSPRISFTDDSIEHFNSGNIEVINGLRNKVAHNGLYISQNDIETKYDFVGYLILSCMDVFNFEYQNLFYELNSLIEKKILRS